MILLSITNCLCLKTQGITQGITENYLDYFRENIFSITFYDSMIVIKKKRMPFVVFNDKVGLNYPRSKSVE